MEIETLAKVVARVIAGSNFVPKLLQELSQYDPTLWQLEAESVIVAGPLKIDVGRCEVFLEDEPLDLRPQELAMLKVLASHPGRVFTREMLLELAWREHGEAVTDTRSVDVCVAKVRAKMGDARWLLRTVPRIGYGLDDRRT